MSPNPELAYSRIDDAFAHHAANTAAVAFPVGSILFHLPETITVTVGFMGIVWYGILIGEKINKWRKAWKEKNG